MAGFEGLGAGLVILLFLGTITCTDIVTVSSLPVCAVTSLQDSIFGIKYDECPADGIASLYISELIEVYLCFLILYFILEVIFVKFVLLL